MATLFSAPLFATTQGITYQGRILTPDGQPLVADSVQFYLRIMVTSKNCSVYTESHTLPMSSGDGAFSMILGKGNRYGNGSVPFANLFSPNLKISAGTTECEAGYVKSDGDTLQLQVAFNAGQGPQSLNAIDLTATPLSFETVNVAGSPSENVLRVAGAEAAPFTPSKFEALLALINGTSSQYLKSAELTNLSLSANQIASGTLSVARGGTGSSDGSIAGSSALNFSAGGTDQNITFSPSGTGSVLLTGKVGIGTTSPKSVLDVAGSVRVGQDPSACSITNNGAIRLNSNTLEYCNSTTWIALLASGSVSGGTVTNVSSSNADIGITANSTTPVLTLNSGTSGGAGDANKIAKLDGTGLLPTGMIPNLSVAKITSGVLPIANGGTNSSATLSNNQLMVSNGGAIKELGAMSDGQIVVGKTGDTPQVVALNGDVTINNTGATLVNKINGTAVSGVGLGSNNLLQNTSGSAIPGNSVLVVNGTGTGVTSLTTPLSGFLTANSSTPGWTAFSADTFTQYALLAGRSGGQTLTGGTAANDNLTLDSTSQASKGNIILGPAGGKVGIGAPSPAYTLDVNGSSRINGSLYLGTFGGYLDADQATGTIRVRSSAGGFSTNHLTVTSSASITGALASSTSITTPIIYGSNTVSGNLTLESTSSGTKGNILLGPTGGNVGIGTTAPNQPLAVWGGAYMDGSMRGVLGLLDTASAAAGTGAGINLGGYTNGTNGPSGFAGINGLKENGIAGNNAGALVFLARPVGGAITEYMRISSTGSVGIGTTSPSAVLHLKAGTATANTAPLKFTAGLLLASPENGAMEFDGTNYYLTAGGTRRAIGSGSIAGTLDSITTINNASGGITLTPAASNSVTINSSTASTSSSTGALIVNGGAGIGGALNVGGAITGGSTISANTSMTTPIIYGSSAASGTLTLDSTSHSTKGNILLAPTGGRVGIGTTAPTGILEVAGGTSSIGDGAHISLAAQSAGGLPGIGGGINLIAGDSYGPAGDYNGGGVMIKGGKGVATTLSGSNGQGGAVTIQGGSGGANYGRGGSVALIGGSPTEGAGGNVTLTGSDGATTTATARSGGSIILTPGSPGGTGSSGAVYISSPATFMKGSAETNLLNVNHYFTGSNSDASGVRNKITTRYQGNETVSNLAALTTFIRNDGGGTILNSRTLWAQAPYSTSGTIQTQYGLAIDSQSSTNITTAFGLYQSGASDLNYFAGKVGIGTTNPLSALEVAGNANQNSSLKVGILEVQSPSDPSSLYGSSIGSNVYYNSGFKARAAGYTMLNAWYSGGFEIRTNPNNYAAGASIPDSDFKRAFRVNPNGSVALGGSLTSTGVAPLNTLAGASMVIDTSGNVGVGTITPSRPLTVASDQGAYYGQVRADVINAGNSAGYLMHASHVGTSGQDPSLLYSDSTVGLDLYKKRVVLNSFANSTAGTGALGVAISLQGTSEGAQDFRVVNGNTLSGTVFTVQQGGNVGIGTATPGAKLDIWAGTEGQTAPVTAMIIEGPNTPLGSNSAQDLSYSFRSAGSARIRAYRGGNWDTYLQFLTNASSAGSDSPQIRMTIDHAGNVGIGTTGPGSTYSAGTRILDIVAPTLSSGISLTPGSATANSFIDFRNSTGTIKGNVWYDGTSGFFGINSLGTNTILNNTGGNVGIGTTAPADKLHVAGDIRVGTGTTGCVKDADGTLIAGTCSSDVRFKKDIKPLGSQLDKVAQLRPVTYHWRAEEFPDKHFGQQTETGLIAQEVQDVLPELVNRDDEGFLRIRFTELNTYILQAVKELYQSLKVALSDIEWLKSKDSEKDRRIAELEAENAAIKARLDRLEKNFQDNPPKNRQPAHQ